jgi:hypothetical protein
VLIDFGHWGKNSRQIEQHLRRFVDQAVFLPHSMEVTCEVHSLTEVRLEGYVTPGGGYKLYADDECHLCFSPMVKQSRQQETEIQIWEDDPSDDVDPLLDNSKRKTVETVVTEYACGTIVKRSSRSKRHPAVVTLGGSCVKLVTK